MKPNYTHTAQIAVYIDGKLFSQSVDRPAMSVEHAQAIMRNAHNFFNGVKPCSTFMSVEDNEGQDDTRHFEISRLTGGKVAETD